MTEVIFDEDRTVSKSPFLEEKAPQKGLGGFFYNMIPGSYPVKRAVLVGIVVALFAASSLIVILGGSDIQLDRETFEERANSKQT